MEIEAKFSAPDAATLARLDELDNLAGYRIAGREVAGMVDVYLDTDDRALQAAGLVCRRRDRGDRVVITVKSRRESAQGDGPGSAGGAAGGGGSSGGAVTGSTAVHRRDEWETVLPGASAPDAQPASWPPGEVRERVLAAAHDKALSPLVELRQSRILRGVSKDERTIAELSLDTLTIVAGERPLPSRHEVEVELKGDGTEADLAQIVAALQRDYPLTPQPLSKFERAMAAVAETASGADRPGDEARPTAGPTPGHEEPSAAELPPADEEPSAEGLLSSDEEHLLIRIARRTDAVGRRARVLLALHEGALQREAGRRAGMAPRTVRYWLNRFRREGLAIFPARLVAGSQRRATQTTPAVSAEPAAESPAAQAPTAGPAPAAGRAPSADPAPAAAPTSMAAQAPAAAEAVRSATAMSRAVKAARAKAKAVAPAQNGAAAGARAASPAAPQAQAAPRHATSGKRASRPGIRAADTMAEAAFKTLRFHLNRMLEHEAGTRKGDDPEDLHDMRVATRRMRAALRVFGPYLDAHTMRPVERGLRRTGRVLGAVRDLDVFYEKTMRYLDSLPEEHRDDLDPLLRVWHERREHARREMLEYLDSGRYARFVETFTALLDDPGRASLPYISDEGEARPHRVSHVLPAVLYDRVAGVWAYDDVITGHDTPLVRFHRLRIAGKAMRYTFEFFEEVLGPDAKPLIATTKDMQDHLGDLQDAVVTCNILRNFLTWGTWDPPSSNARGAMSMIVAPGVAAYLAARQEELNNLVDTFPQMWTHIRGGEFSRRLAKVVGEL